MRAKPLPKNIHSWAGLEVWLRPQDKQTKGAVFEYLTQKYLQFEPRYRSQLKHIWLLKEVPTAVAEKLKLAETDQGIDLICETHEGDYWSVQCKFVTDTDKKISHRQISTFVSLSFGLSKKIRFGLVCTTVDDYAAIYRGKSNIGFVLSDEWQKLGEDFFAFARGAGQAKPKPPPRLAPHPHQTKAISAAHKYFTKNKETRGKLVFPCGAGKSLTGYWIARKLAAKSIVVAVPSLALVKQTLETWLAQASADKYPLRWLCVCSDESIGKNDDVAIHTQDLGVPCVTDPAQIAAWLKQNKNQAKIIFTTYQSARALGDALRKLPTPGPSPRAGRGDRRSGWGFDLGILDEAHKTVGANDKLFSYLLYDKNVKIKRRIFMTATERRYRGSSDDIVSMDDVELFGDTFEHMSFAHAVENGILSDYKIVTLAISNQDIAEAVKDNNLRRDGVEARSYAALVALRKAMQKYPIKHAVSFHGSIAKAEDFKQQQDVFSEEHPEFSRLETFHVSGAMPTARRSKIIQEFAQSPSSLITNAKCLTEGVDVPKIDAVLFADLRRSTVDIVQAVGRALRKSPGKKTGYVILPLFTGDATGDAILESDDFKEIIQTLRALASNDERIVEYFRDVSKGKRPRGKLIDFDIDVKATADFDAETLVRELELRTWNRLAKLNWRPFEEAREFVRGLGLRGQKEWITYASSKARPPDIPHSPARSYAGIGWKNFGDWLGTGNIATWLRQYRNFADARMFVHSLKLSNQSEWRKSCKAGKIPADIPANPYNTYADTGWKNWGDWLGTGSIAAQLRKYRRFADARKFARSLHLQSSSEWFRYCKSGQKPADIPTKPYNTYAETGWSNWGDWLGTDTVASYEKKFRNFIEARSFVQSLKLPSYTAWRKYCNSDQKPEDIPTGPSRVYADNGWVGWGDWLGTSTVATRFRQYWPFNKARKFARSLNLTKQSEWFKYCKSGKKPVDIPANANMTYKEKGWVSWGDWLGTGIIANKSKRFRKFEAAREFTHSLKLKGQSEWRAYSKTREKPDDIPANPEKIYADVGWQNWGDWLGTGSIASASRTFRAFAQAREFACSLKLHGQSEWFIYCKSGKKPADIPTAPSRTYKDKGWLAGPTFSAPTSAIRLRSRGERGANPTLYPPPHEVERGVSHESV